MSRRDTLLSALACLVFGVWLAATVPSSPALGWDESMHAELPAARVALALRAGELGTAAHSLLGCAQYPPAWPAVLGLAQVPAGVSELLARGLTSLAWAVGLFFAFAVTHRAARASGRVDPRTAPWAALALGMLCPLAASFSGTLFLEVPSALATGFALWAWMRRADGPRAQRELVAGIAVAVALFTKWNYGLLLGAALAIDWVFELVAARKAGRSREFLLRARWLVAAPLAACLWWFVLPLPGGLDLAREHRAAFAGFLAGNLGATPATAAERILFAATGIGATVRLTVLVVVLAFAALRSARVPAVRVLVLAAGLLLGAPLVHPFFLDRFLIPGLVPLFALAGLGLALLLPREGPARTATIGILALASLLAPGRDGGWLADALERLPAEDPARGYVLGVLEDRVRLGPGRRLPTGGLERVEHDALLDLVAREVRAGERVGWIGMSSEISPAALHLGLLARGGGPAWFLDAHPPRLDVAYFGVDPTLDESELRAYAGRFDVILWTDPIDLRERRERAFVAGYRDWLLAIQASDVRELGRVAIARPLRAPLEVRLYACRRVP
ncbi:MAG: hypothetical protein NTY35_00930 [Planctomycetota bacterium]|nr:hypothetical protein [Planctomycetota bacterium]